MIERRDEGEASLLTESLPDVLPALRVAVIGDDVGAVADRRRRFTAGASSGITITAGMSCNAAASAIACPWLPEEYVTTRSAFIRGRGDGVVGATELERAGALEALGLEPEMCIEALVEGSAGEFGGDVGDTGEPLGCPGDVVDVQLGFHVATVGENVTP